MSDKLLDFASSKVKVYAHTKVASWKAFLKLTNQHFDDPSDYEKNVDWWNKSLTCWTVHVLMPMI